MSQLGPLDRRVIRKRCVACARRKIKCDGGLPCVYCLKKKQDCIPQAPSKSTLVFVNTSKGLGDCTHALAFPRQTSLNSSLSTPQDQFIKHFFSGFLARNDLGGVLDLDTIVSGFQNSPSLYNVVVAIGASDRSTQHGPSTSKIERLSRPSALKAYRASVIQFQAEVQGKDFLQATSSLWTTFFLGLFELMYDITGDGWVKHILYGTSRILQLRGPKAHVKGAGRSFFLAIRVFEICRALIYSDSTFLSEKAWVNLSELIWDGEENDWHPKETLFDLMTLCSGLNQSVMEVVECDTSYIIDDKLDNLFQFTIKGHQIRTALREWFVNFQSWSQKSDVNKDNNHSTLATIYYHAISIYLSGIFDYRSEFRRTDAPTLPQHVIQNHVDAILLHATAALKTRNIGGILFLFPLRVAGARVTTIQETDVILNMLKDISSRGFIVANAFISDLQNLWANGRTIV